MIKKNRLIAPIFMTVICLGLGASQGPADRLPTDPRQLVVVRTAGWAAVAGTLQAYDWDPTAHRWRPALPALPVVVGQQGLAWGHGLHDPALHQPPLKREGDRKAPAGVFAIEGAFAYARDANLAGCRLPLTVVQGSTLCVDDPASGHYNRLVDQDTARRDWQSAEQMRRPDVLYKYGLVVGYNTGASPQPGDGSCIFVHIWSGAGQGTLGCTAMTEVNLLGLLRWLDPAQRPALVQAPGEAYAALARRYGLPD
jgi:L,D-peptidoglycan transpeptidase YkuD (ErfK/YbiS/YcfS/YnhG family)